MAVEPIGVGADSRLPRRVREQLATEVADPETEVGASVEATIAGSVGELNDPAVAGLIDDTESDTRDRLNATIGAGTGTIYDGGIVGGSSAAAAANTTRIQAMLDSPFYRAVVLPDDLIYVSALNIPANKELTGAYSRAYTTRPATGTRLQCATASQTTPVITMNGRSKLTNIAVLGATGGASHSVVRIASNGAVLSDCALGFGVVGLNGNYKLAIVHNVHVYANSAEGISNILDGKVYFCTINANGGNGVSALTGANATEYIGNRVEWNNGHGFNVFEANSVTIMGNIVDRNGKAGVRLAGAVGPVVVGNKMWRNGAKSSGVSADDCNLYVATVNGGVIEGNRTAIGDNDGGGGYMSPAVAMRSQGNTDTIVSLNDLRGGTSASVASITPDTNPTRMGNKLKAGEFDATLGLLGYIDQLNLLNVASGGGVASGVLNLPALSTYSTGHMLSLEVTARSHSSSAAYGARIEVVISRATDSDAIVTAVLTNIAGSAFGLGSGILQVELSVNPTGSELTVQATNTAASAAFSFAVRAK